MTSVGSSSAAKVEDFLFLGTGTSSTVPSIACLTDEERGCLCCRSTLTDKGAKNRRRNTSGIVRVRHNGQLKTILVDSGKSFYPAAVEHFPKNNLRRLDAVILTHPHADAINGLDDLRAWTLGGCVQKSVEVFCDQKTFDSVKVSFPYLVSKDFATGGGDLPEFDWHVIETDKPFEVCGITITPLPVHHGRYFTTDEPYICLGFLFGRQLAYLSDVSLVPDAVLKTLSPEAGGAVEVLVVDVLRIPPHASHFGIGNALQLTRHVKPKRSYWTGFAHRATHDDWLALAAALEAGRKQEGPFSPSLGALRAEAFETWSKSIDETDTEAFTKAALQEIASWQAEGEPLWARPAYDGLKVTWRDGGHLLDSDDANVTT